MIIASIILSSLALLAGVINIILFLVEKKRTNRRHQALMDYIHNECDGTLDGAEEFVEKYVNEFFEKSAKNFNTENRAFFERFSSEIEERFVRQQQDIDNLKNGVCPDYEKALAAANAVNDFNAGISAIMNFDPIAAAKARRQNGDKEVS